MAAASNTIANKAESLGGIYGYELEKGAELTGLVKALISIYSQVVTSGRATTTLAVKLPGNAVVRELELELRADRASWTAIGAAGQVRANGTTVIVDLGLARTVAAVGVRAGSKLLIMSVRSWTGAKFEEKPAFPVSKTGTPLAFFPSEIQTQRLEIELAAAGSEDAIEEDIAVQLPDLPADLEVRIDDGPPVFTHKGSVREGDRGWAKTEKGTTLRVSLASAFAALTGNSQDTAERTFVVTLSAQAPGVLGLEEKARIVDCVWLTPLGPEGSLELDFESEGFLDVPLNVDAGTGTLRELRATLASSFGAARALPPVGPPLSSQAELMLNADRAAAARVSSEHADALSELIAVRLPLTAGEQGAELRVAFAEHDPDSDGPGDLTRAPQSKPLVLPPGDGTESWVTLELAAPLPLDEDALPWMVVLVSRGEVAWSLASGESNDGSTLRCGSPAGPWERLP